jgi:hypothetical protein
MHNALRRLSARCVRRRHGALFDGKGNFTAVKLVWSRGGMHQTMRRSEAMTNPAIARQQGSESNMNMQVHEWSRAGLAKPFAEHVLWI